MLAYKKYGTNQSTIPLVMVHGFLCGGKFFEPNITEISKTIDVITLDLPGFGDSYDIVAVDSIKAMSHSVLHTLSIIGCKKCYLLGHSMGGMVALQMTIDSPDTIAKLVIYASNSDGNLVERFETFAASKKRIQTMNIEKAKTYICTTWFREGQKNKYFPLCMSCNANVSQDTMLKALDAMNDFNLTASLPTITIPVLIIAAELDRTYAVKRLKIMQSHLANAQLIVMQNCSHNAHLEAETLFSLQVVNFIMCKSKLLY